MVELLTLITAYRGNIIHAALALKYNTYIIISSIIQEANMKLMEYSYGACFLCINHNGPFWMQKHDKKERDGMVFVGYEKVLVDIHIGC